MLLCKSGLLYNITATAGKNTVMCSGMKDVWSPPTTVLEFSKLDASHERLELLGRLVQSPSEKDVAIFTVKVRSVIRVYVYNERMGIKLTHFPPVTNESRLPHANEKMIRSFGKVASVCDYNAASRSIVFISGESIGIYAFDEAFKRIDVVKVIDLSVRSTLSSLPFTDVLILDSAVYITDSSGQSQAIDIVNEQTSCVIDAWAGNTCKSRMMALADNLVVAVISVTTGDNGSCILQCVTRDDNRQLPVLPLETVVLPDQVCIQNASNQILVLDSLAGKLYALSIDVTVQSDSYRMRQFDEEGMESSENEVRDSMCPRKQHWLYAFYHVFEKFPVLGMLESGPPNLIALVIACPASFRVGSVLEDCHDFLSFVMSDLKGLNKPLHELDLTKGLAVVHSLENVELFAKSLVSFLQELITFLPVQICRAEGNTLTVLRNGTDQSLEAVEGDMETWGATEIAESMRFGVLSPLLSAWGGRCVVITSMGKQSTGKSYFLNHLAGSSFAIAGNRCTDGAWMALRMMNDVLLVVLDFEGLGSFERTDQEDVFLAVLNASLSMFTIFRMEMRLDKDIERLFTKFQKGMNLLKNDERLFRGTLYMSVKDVNPNDRRSVLTEFQQKFQKLLKNNRERNFLTDMYSGKVGINCSPPLGTFGYYESLRHARAKIMTLVNDPHGCITGLSFHECIRLVLAKISILDWTAVDESSQRLQINDLHRKLPGVLRTGWMIPVETQANADTIPDFVKEPLLRNGVESSLCWQQLSQDYPEYRECWARINHAISLDEWVDDEIDVGPAICAANAENTNMVHITLLGLFQHFLELLSKGALEKISARDYETFDAVLLFLVCRRKAKAALWVKQVLGVDRYMEEWRNIEQTFFQTFDTLLKRCQHGCTECQLQCMRSRAHPSTEKHDCGLGHQCRGLCNYCVQLYRPGKQTPHCAIEAGHEGKCDCGKGDHSCGAICGLANASNCAKLCVLDAGHKRGHRCSVQLHLCGVECSARNCSGKCILNVEHRHTVHKCTETQCNHACEMENCKERCSTSNHFHDEPTLWLIFAQENNQAGDEKLVSAAIQVVNSGRSVRHLCNSRHMCGGICEEQGVCSKSVQVSSEKFSGACDSFNFVQNQMVASRSTCSIVLEPGQRTHDGRKHSCTKRHSCNVQCAACEYYCDKPFGHRDEHSAAHGSMTKMHFVAQDKIIAWRDHTYAAGEKGVAEMCSMHCSSAGRGHVHYMKCGEGATNCGYVGLRDQRRHCESILKPDPGYEVDEILHGKYWRTIGWADPCESAAERESFTKCPFMCNAPDHKSEGKTPSYCDLHAWHLPATLPPFFELGVSYIDGHRFACSHEALAGISHHVFVLDCSGSMKGGHWQMLVKGVHEYLQVRLQSGSTQDIVSAITFGDSGKVEYECARIKSAAGQYINFRGGGTYFAKGLKEANAVLSRSNAALYKPVLIFFTDGRPADQKQGLKQAKDIRSRFVLHGLQAFVIGYGRVSEVGLLALANALGGTVHQAGEAADLCETFRVLSLSVGARAGLIHSGDTK